MPRKAASVFSNIGVGEAYLHDAKYEVVAACELEQERCEVYRKIYPDSKVVCGSITDHDVREKFKQAAKGSFLLIATPPCQGFSTLGPKRKGEDPRNSLVANAFQLAHELQPAYFLLENVPQMVKAFKDQIVQEFVKGLLPGYKFRFEVLDAADYGTPQRRRRAIFLCSRHDMPVWEVPAKSGPRVTLREAIGDLPSLEAGESSPAHKWHKAGRHSEHHVRWMRHTPTGKTAFDNAVEFPRVKENGADRRIKGFGNTYKRMDWDEPAPTLIMGSHMVSSSNTVHPGRPLEDGTYSDARTLSVLEAMRVMGLPDDWPLPEMSHKDAIQYLGEGFCPKLVKALIEAIPGD